MNSELAKAFFDKVEVWKADPAKWIEDCISIIDKNGNTVKLVPNAAQRKILESLATSKRLSILKARQLGSTTFICAYFLWRVMFETNCRVAIVAHTGRAASQIFEIVQGMYERLPKVFKSFSLWAPTSDNKSELSLKNGGKFRVGTASSQFWRGTTFNALHLSEFAFWTDIGNSMASIMQSAADSAQVVIETTANGSNDFKTLWEEAVAGDNGYDPLFLSWLDHTEYRLKGPLPKEATAEEVKFGADVGMEETSFNWYVQTKRAKCMNDQSIFNQEYPSDPTLAFKVSGDRFFSQLYPINRSQIPQAATQNISEPVDGASYCIGVDVAGGGMKGDASVIQVIDVTDPTRCIHVGETIIRKEPRLFARDVETVTRKWASKAHHVCLVVEVNNHGLAVIDYLRDCRLPTNSSMFTRKNYDGYSQKYVQAYGFNTNSSTRPMMLGRLKEFVESGFLQETKMQRTRMEMNAFVFNEKNKAEATSGAHDDAVIALGLALMGMDQVKRIQKTTPQHEPETLRDKLLWELNNGRLWNNGNYSSDSEIEEELNDMLGCGVDWE